jgi:hypothetical protein
MAELVAASSAANRTVTEVVDVSIVATFYYDPVLLEVTRCEVVGLVAGSGKVRASAASRSASWEYSFIQSESVPVTGIRFLSSLLNGVAFSFDQL